MDAKRSGFPPAAQLAEPAQPMQSLAGIVHQAPQPRLVVQASGLSCPDCSRPHRKVDGQSGPEAISGRGRSKPQRTNRAENARMMRLAREHNPAADQASFVLRWFAGAPLFHLHSGNRPMSHVSLEKPNAAAPRLGPAVLPLGRAGHWELLAQIETTRFCEIYRARPAGTPSDPEAPYTLKLLRAEWEGIPEAVAILRREAAVGCSVSHPHLIPVLAGHVDAPPYFVVTPWLPGATLDQLARHPLDVPESVWIVRQVAEALAALESAGWTHGDIKPRNVLVSPEGHATLLDLGFCRRGNEAVPVAQEPLLGTVAYMAPERLVSSAGADIRSDIYSLGVVLYELVSGRLPFEAKDLSELVVAHRQSRPADLRRVAPHLPPELCALIGQMLAKEPLRRPQSPTDLIQRLVALEIATFGQRASG